MGKVPIQKGPIHADMKTMKSMSREEKVEQRIKEVKLLRSGGCLTLNVPKK